VQRLRDQCIFVVLVASTWPGRLLAVNPDFSVGDSLRVLWQMPEAATIEALTYQGEESLPIKRIELERTPSWTRLTQLSIEGSAGEVPREFRARRKDLAIGIYPSSRGGTVSVRADQLPLSGADGWLLPLVWLDVLRWHERNEPDQIVSSETETREDALIHRISFTPLVDRQTSKRIAVRLTSIARKSAGQDRWLTYSFEVEQRRDEQHPGVIIRFLNWRPIGDVASPNAESGVAPFLIELVFPGRPGEVPLQQRILIKKWMPMPVNTAEPPLALPEGVTLRDTDEPVLRNRAFEVIGPASSSGAATNREANSSPSGLTFWLVNNWLLVVLGGALTGGVILIWLRGRRGH
jgi:hypothetical protein